MDFTKNGFDQFRFDLQEAFAAVGKRHDISIKHGKITYSDTSFSFKVECVKTDVGDVKKSEFEKFCKLYGLEPEDYGRQFILEGKTYRLDGLNLNAQKYRCRCTELSSGDSYKMTLDSVRTALGRKG